MISPSGEDTARNKSKSKAVCLCGGVFESQEEEKQQRDEKGSEKGGAKRDVRGTAAGLREAARCPSFVLVTLSREEGEEEVSA